jgi:hypothetical protein
MHRYHSCIALSALALFWLLPATATAGIGTYSNWFKNDETGDVYVWAETWGDYDTMYYYDAYVATVLHVYPYAGGSYDTCESESFDEGGDAFVDAWTIIDESADFDLVSTHEVTASYQDYTCFIYQEPSRPTRADHESDDAPSTFLPGVARPDGWCDGAGVAYLDVFWDWYYWDVWWDLDPFWGMSWWSEELVLSDSIQKSGSIQRPCPFPNYETATGFWGSWTGAVGGVFTVTVGSGLEFGHRAVQEMGSGGSDGCYFEGSIIGQLQPVFPNSGVQLNNMGQFQDTIGVPYDYWSYYSDNHPNGGCTMSAIQMMYIDRCGIFEDSPLYVTNNVGVTLELNEGTPHWFSYRAGAIASQRPSPRPTPHLGGAR